MNEDVRTVATAALLLAGGELGAGRAQVGKYAR
jgi:hypothetical protein